MEDPMDRGKRLARTWRYARRAQKEHIKVAHRYSEIDCTCELHVLYFRKRKALGCRGSKKGSASTPKLGSCCKLDGLKWRASTEERIASRRLAKKWFFWVRSFHPNDFPY